MHAAVRLDFVWEYVAGPVHTAERLAAWDTGLAGMDGYLTRYRPDTVVLPHRYW